MIKRTLTIALSLTLLLAPLAGLGQGRSWRWLTGNRLLNVKFWPGTNEGWIVGLQGLILHTTDDGDHWEVQNSNTQQDLFGIFFLDQNNGWVTGGYKTCLRTRDGGRNWQVVHTEPSGFSHFKGVCFLDTLVGWVVGPYDSILKTTDGGVTWNGIDRGIMNYYISITFPDSLHGWTASDGVITSTTNGGISWQDTTLPGEYIDFVDTLHGWDVRVGSVIRTSNGGRTWSLSNPTSAFLYGVSFFDTSWGVTVGGENYNLATILQTSNGGINWASRRLTQNFAFYGVSSPELGTSFVVGQSGSIAKTTDMGLTWSIVRNADFGFNSILGVSFFNQNTGWSVGTYETITKTTNGGTVWVQQNINLSDFWFYGIDGVDLNHAWTCGDRGTFATTNGGTTWVWQDSAAGVPLYAIDMLDTLLGVCVGGYSGGVIRRTTDGHTWQGVTTSQCLYNLSFGNRFKGWACGASGTILLTTDAGTTWQSQISGVTNALYWITFHDTLHGWTCGSGGRVLWTTDGGMTWNIGNSGVTQYLLSIAFTDTLTGFATSDNGLIIRSTDGGRNWVTDTSNCYSNFPVVFALDSTHVWTVGSYGMVLGWGEAGEYGVEESGQSVKGANGQEAKFGQSYPNPTRGIASFEYETAQAEKVRVRVYNVAGQLVRTLVDSGEPVEGPDKQHRDLRFASTGRHIVTWDGKDNSGKNVRSGTYFYCLEAGERKAVRKMVVIR